MHGGTSGPEEFTVTALRPILLEFRILTAGSVTALRLRVLVFLAPKASMSLESLQCAEPALRVCLGLFCSLSFCPWLLSGTLQLTFWCCHHLVLAFKEKDCSKDCSLKGSPVPCSQAAAAGSTREGLTHRVNQEASVARSLHRILYLLQFKVGICINQAVPFGLNGNGFGVSWS